MEIINHERVYVCGKCNLPFDNQYDRWEHQKGCTDTLLLPTAEPVIKAACKTFTQYLEESASKDPFNYKRYIGRININEPNSMIDAYGPRKRRSHDI